MTAEDEGLVETPKSVRESTSGSEVHPHTEVCEIATKSHRRLTHVLYHCKPPNIIQNSTAEVAPRKGVRGCQAPHPDEPHSGGRGGRSYVLARVPCARNQTPSPLGPLTNPDDIDAWRWLPGSRIGASVPVVGLTRGGGTEQHPLGRVRQVLIHVIRPMRPRRKRSWEKTVRTSRRNDVGELLGTSSY